MREGGALPPSFYALRSLEFPRRLYYWAAQGPSALQASESACQPHARLLCQPSSRTKRTITMTMTSMPISNSMFLLYRRLGRLGLTFWLLILLVAGINRTRASEKTILLGK